jgi:hypothetical protein
MHQKYSSYALTNLLFGLCKSVWVTELLVNLPSPHPGAPACPSTPEVQRARERAPTHFPSIVFTFGLVVSPSRSLGVRHDMFPIGFSSIIKTCLSNIKFQFGVFVITTYLGFHFQYCLLFFVHDFDDLPLNPIVAVNSSHHLIHLISQSIVQKWNKLFHYNVII